MDENNQTETNETPDQIQEQLPATKSRTFPPKPSGSSPALNAALHNPDPPQPSQDTVAVEKSPAPAAQIDEAIITEHDHDPMAKLVGASCGPRGKPRRGSTTNCAKKSGVQTIRYSFVPESPITSLGLYRRS